MAAKKPSRKKKFAPVTNLAEELRKQGEADAAKHPKYAPLTDLSEQLKRSLKKQQKKGKGSA